MTWIRLVVPEGSLWCARFPPGAMAAALVSDPAAPHSPAGLSCRTPATSRRGHASPVGGLELVAQLHAVLRLLAEQREIRLPDTHDLLSRFSRSRSGQQGD